MEKQKCFYCKKREADEKFSYIQTMYQIYKRTYFPLGYSYNSRDIKIPRCSSCYKKQTNFFRILFLPSFILVSIVILSMTAKTTFSIIVAILFSLFLGVLLTSLLNRIFFKIIYKIPSDSEVDSYPEIHALLELNWRKNRPDPAGASEADLAYDSPEYIAKQAKKKKIN